MYPFRADLIDSVRSLERRTQIMLAAGLIGGVAAVLGPIVGGWLYLFGGMPKIPDAEALWTVNREPAIEFVDRNGVTIGVRGPRYGRVVPVQEMPDHLWQAFLAIEDEGFYRHEGVDQFAILRAAIVNAMQGRTVQGGSTITQQLVKNLFLTPDRTIRRKAQEIRLAGEIEHRLTKDEILTLYLNRVFLGGNAYGVDAAAKRYFGKPATKVTLAEAAMLASLPKAPSRFAPTANLQDALQRQRLVLNRMVEAKFITRAAADAAAREKIVIVQQEPSAEFGYVMDMAAERAKELVGDKAPDLIVRLTVDAKVQRAGALALRETLARDGAQAGAREAALVVMDLKGGVRAVVGGRSYADSFFNRATQAMRQPGSAFKTFVYGAAFEKGMKPWTVKVDAPITIEGWSPKNYDEEFRGSMTLESAYARSINTISAQVAYETGLRNVVAFAQRAGITSKLYPYPAISLGSDVTTLYEMTRAYGAFATGGMRLDPYFITAIDTSRGKSLYRRPAYEQQRVMDEAVARNMNSMMKLVVTNGTGRGAQLPGRETAGKTGTSQSFRDAWFVGFTGDLLGGVWVGNDDEKPMSKVTGGGIPARIWRQAMVVAHEGLKPRPLLLSDEAAPPVDLTPADGDGMAAFYDDLANAFAMVVDPPPTVDAEQPQMQ